jgi:hypothetical protein
MQHIYVAAMKTEFGDPTTKLSRRFRVSDFRNGNEWEPWTATGFPIHLVFLFWEIRDRFGPARGNKILLAGERRLHQLYNNYDKTLQIPVSWPHPRAAVKL